MRKMFTLALAALLTGTLALAQTQKLEGNGKLVTREIPVKSFNSLKASGVFELQLVQGSEEGVKIEADENLQDLFAVKNDGGQLVVEMKTPKNTSLNSKNKMKVYVSFKNLRRMDIRTVGAVKSSNELSFDNLELHNQSVGDVQLHLTANKLNLHNRAVGGLKLSGKAQEAVFVNNGVGHLDAGNLVVQTMNIDNNGVGSAEVNAQKGLQVKESFLGKVKNKGAAPVRKKNIVVI